MKTWRGHPRVKRVRQRVTDLAAPILWSHLESVHFSIGQMQSRLNAQLRFSNVQDAEFSVFSQFGGDGIVQYMVNQLPTIKHTFIELGAGSYQESNTRFLVQNNRWEGLVVDAGVAHLEFLETPWLRWRHRVYGRSSFITTENVNAIIRSGGFEGEIGLLSIDIDGNDYWILEAINGIDPQVLVLEYNSLFGSEQALVVPYDPSFVCGSADPSQLYFGASLGALTHLAEARGYRLVCSDRAGVNAYFVRKDVGTELPHQTVDEAWVLSQHRMANDPDVWLPSELLQRERLRMIRDLVLLDVNTGAECKVKDRFDIG